MGRIKRNKNTINLIGHYLISMYNNEPLMFLLDRFKRLGQKSEEKIGVFLEELRAPQFPSEIS